MKFKPLALLVGALVALTPIAIHTAQALPPNGPVLVMLQQLKLTPQQKDQFNAVRTQTREAIAQILTPQQEEILKKSLEQGKTLREAKDAIKLTEAQQQQIRETLASAYEQGSEILTPQQRSQFFKTLQARLQSGKPGFR
ncbi:MAG: hypothetical protein WCD18_11170 [Thermosynechococcaceae cyanobacterium]